MKRTSERGFTLIEVMVAMVILAMSVIALMNLQGNSLLAVGRAERISTSTMLARQKLSSTLLEIEKGIPKGDFPDEKEEEGVFEGDDYFWRLRVKKVELPGMGAEEGGGESGDGENEIMRQAMKLLSEELARSVREVRLTVGWKELEEEQKGITVVTHVVNPLGKK